MDERRHDWSSRKSPRLSAGLWQQQETVAATAAPDPADLRTDTVTTTFSAQTVTGGGRRDTPNESGMYRDDEWRIDMLNSINTALQNVSMKPTDSKPYRISDEREKILANMDWRGWSSPTTAQWQRIAQTQKPDRVKRHSTKFCTERQQTNRCK